VHHTAELHIREVGVTPAPRSNASPSVYIAVYLDPRSSLLPLASRRTVLGRKTRPLLKAGPSRCVDAEGEHAYCEFSDALARWRFPVSWWWCVGCSRRDSHGVVARRGRIQLFFKTQIQPFWLNFWHFISTNCDSEYWH